MRFIKDSEFRKVEIVVDVIQDMLPLIEEQAGFDCFCLIGPIGEERRTGLNLMHVIKRGSHDYQIIEIVHSGNSDVIFVTIRTRDSIVNDSKKGQKQEAFDNEEYIKIAKFIIDEMIKFEKRH